MSTRHKLTRRDYLWLIVFMVGWWIVLLGASYIGALRMGG